MHFHAPDAPMRHAELMMAAILHAAAAPASQAGWPFGDEAIARENCRQLLFRCMNRWRMVMLADFCTRRLFLVAPTSFRRLPPWRHTCPSDAFRRFDGAIYSRASFMPPTMLHCAGFLYIPRFQNLFRSILLFPRRANVPPRLLARPISIYAMIAFASDIWKAIYDMHADDGREKWHISLPLLFLCMLMIAC